MRISDWSSDVCSSDLALDDPFVAGVDARRQLRVRHARARQCRSGAGQDRAPRHAASPLRKFARSSVTWRVISFSISSAHRWTQFATPFASALPWLFRSEEHTSELQSLMRISYAVFC